MFEKNYDAVEFGARIKKLRKESGMTQETLADLLFLSSDSISRMENGKGMCMPEHVVHICEIFDVTSDYLYFGNSVNNETKIELLSTINKILSECDLDELKSVEQMIKLFMRK